MVDGGWEGRNGGEKNGGMGGIGGVDWCNDKVKGGGRGRLR